MYVLNFPEGWPSGLRRTPGKRVGVNASQGFESLSLRHLMSINNEELDSFKKANLALRYLSLMKDKDDLLEQSKRQLSSYQFDNRLDVF